MAFDNLKKNSGTALAKLQQQVNASKGGAKDPRQWKIPYDADKNGTALIRLLPWGDGERTPWVEWTEFSFNGKGGRYWNRSLKSIGQEDPVEELNQAHWNLARELNEDFKTGKESGLVKTRGRKMQFVCNIFVLEDNMNPENVGQVKLFKYGAGIHKKIQDALTPQYKDQSPIQVFDFWEGANLRVRSKGKQVGKNLLPNYEDSAFGTPEPLHADNNVLRGIYDKMIDLTEFEAPSNYKSYDDLRKEMLKAVGPREVSRIMGEDFNPAMAEANGANPFPQAGGGEQADAFARSTQNQPAQQQAQQQAPVDNDPFANVGQAEGGDAFAQAANKQADPEADPFANAGGDAFATGGADAPAQQQQADPFAQSGGNQAAPQQQAPVDDPFAGLTV